MSKEAPKKHGDINRKSHRKMLTHDGMKKEPVKNIWFNVRWPSKARIK